MASALQTDFSFNSQRLIAAIPILLGISAFAHNALLGHMDQSGVSAKLTAGCPVDRFTGSDGVDGLLCLLVNFFHGSLQDLPGRLFTVDFLASFSVIITITLIEGARRGQSWLLAFPAVVATAAQLLGIGVVAPLYCILFALTNKPKKAKDTAITQAKAESIFLGIVVGFVIPSISMIAYVKPSTTAFWQAFPLLVAAVQNLFLALRPSAPESGYFTVQMTLLFCLIGCASVHLAIMAPLLFDTQSALWSPAQWLAFLPSVRALDPSVATVAAGAIHFLQWDEICSFISMFLTSTLFARDLGSGVKIAAWSVVGSLLFSPGAALASIWLWREASLEAARQAEDAKAKRA